jgi:hypothetical protein
MLLCLRRIIERFRAGVGGPRLFLCDRMPRTPGFKVESVALSEGQNLPAKCQLVKQIAFCLIGAHQGAIVLSEQLGVFAFLCVILQVALNVKANVNECFSHFAILTARSSKRNRPFVPELHRRQKERA